MFEGFKSESNFNRILQKMARNPECKNQLQMLGLKASVALLRRWESEELEEGEEVLLEAYGCLIDYMENHCEYIHGRIIPLQEGDLDYEEVGAMEIYIEEIWGVYRVNYRNFCADTTHWMSNKREAFKELREFSWGE